MAVVIIREFPLGILSLAEIITSQVIPYTLGGMVMIAMDIAPKAAIVLAMGISDTAMSIALILITRATSLTAVTSIQIIAIRPMVYSVGIRSIPAIWKTVEVILAAVRLRYR
ncbi:MAG: hypothetical protein COA47_09730 [Robiginitomaculum sp.]|nr:MAG: hypothetical protein COA47_09730 [Robiginitomaculum sp.]